MCTSTRSKLFLAKLEATAGTPESLTPGTDDLFVLMDSGGITNGVEAAPINGASPTGNAYPSIVASRKPQAQIKVPFYGKGKAGDPSVVVVPKWAGVILQTIGHVDLSTGTGAELKWTPDVAFPRFTDSAGATTAARSTFTLGEFVDRDGSIVGGAKTLRRMTGCRPSRVQFVFTPGQLAHMVIDILGQFVIDDSVTTDLSLANLDGVATDFMTPNAAGSQLTFTGPTVVKTKVSTCTWTLDLGMEHIMGDDAASGVVCVQGTEPVLTGSIDPIIAPADVDRYASAYSNLDVLAYGFANANGIWPQGRSGGTGYGVKMTVPELQVLGNIDGQSKVTRAALECTAVASTQRPLFTLSVL